MISANENILTEIRPLPIRYTVDDLEFLPEDLNRYELIGGKLFTSGVPHLDHQRLITSLIFQFGLYLQKNLIGEIVSAPGVIFSSKDSVIPDVVFATHETVKEAVPEEGQRFEGYFTSAPELIIEILSYGKSDFKRDRVYKRELYGKYKVKEYWVVDGLFNTIEVYRLS